MQRLDTIESILKRFFKFHLVDIEITMFREIKCMQTFSSNVIDDYSDTWN